MFGAIISIYLIGIGLSAVRISLLISISSLISMTAQPLIGFLQDRFSRKSVSIVMLVLSSVTGLLFSLTRNYVLLILFYGVTITLTYGANPYIERLATLCREFSYRSIRIWGTIGYAVGSQIAGYVYEHFSGGSNYIFFSIFIIAAAFGVLMIRTGEEKTDSAARKDVSRNYKREVLKNGNFIKYLIITAAFYCTMSLNAVYLPALYQSEGVAVTTVTTIMFISTMMEIPVIFFAARFMEKLHNMQLMTVSFSIAFLQFLLYVLIPVPAVQAVVTVLCRSTSTMIYIMINMKVIADIVPPAYQMSALTLVTALSGSLTSIIMQNVGGQIIDHFSIRALYIFMAGIMAFGLILLYVLKVPKGRKRDMFN